MNDTQIADFIGGIKIESDVKTQSFDPSTTFDFITTVKSEPRSYIKEEIDIPFDEANNTDPDYNCLRKACSNLNNRVCSIVIERLSDSILRKYCGNKIQTEVNIRKYYRYTSQSNQNVQNSITNNEENSIIESNIYKTVNSCENSNTQHDNIKNNGNENERKKIRGWYRDRQTYAGLSTCYCPTCNQKYIPYYALKCLKCFKCKVRLLHECKKCYKLLTTYHGMARHIQHECSGNKYYYECFECSYQSNVLSDVRNHVRHKHPNSLFYDRIKKITRINKQELQVDSIELISTNKCLTFGREFGVDMLIKHMQVCPKGLNEHLRDYTRSEKIMKRHCPQCHEEIMVSMKETASVQDTKLCNKCHVVMNFKCSHCQKQYSNFNGIIHHLIRSHFDKQYACSKCNYKASTLSYLSTHYSRWHRGSKVHRRFPYVMFDVAKTNQVTELQCGERFRPDEKMENQSVPEKSKVEHTDLLTPGVTFDAEKTNRAAEPNCKEGFTPMKEVENQNNWIENVQIIISEHTYPLSPCVTFDAEKTNRVTELHCEEDFRLEKEVENQILPLRNMQKKRVKRIYECGHPNCSFKAVNQQSLQQHIAKVHVPEYKTVACPRCSMVLKKSRLADHLSRHRDDFCCDYCLYKTNSKNLIEEHLFRFHRHKYLKYLQ